MLGALLCTSVNIAFAEENIDLPVFDENEVVVVKPENSVPFNVLRDSSQNKSPIYLSKEEVKEIQVLQAKYREKMKELPIDNFIEKPILKDGIYKIGTPNDEALKLVENKLNFYRELAGVKPVEVSEPNNEFAQYGAIGLAATNEYSHDLSEKEKPSDMTEDFWLKACDSAKNSNLSKTYTAFYKNENSFSKDLDTFITDYGNPKVGHRLWILGLQGTSFGVGQAKSNDLHKEYYSQWYSTLFINFDFNGISERYANDSIMHWPSSGNYPFQVYNLENTMEKNMRWSVAFNELGYKLTDDVSVEILNNSTGERTLMGNDKNGGELTVFGAEPKMKPRGGYNSVVFKPNDDFVVQSDTKYTVTIKGLLKDNAPYTHIYTTYMADMDAEYVDRDESVKELEVYKKESKNNLSEYKNKSDYREREQQVITRILTETNAKIDGAKDKASVDVLVKEAKTALDKAKTDKELTAEEVDKSFITYKDVAGSHDLSIDKNAKVKLSVSSKTVTIRVDKEKYKLQDLKEITFKGLTINNTVSFNLDGIEKVTLDNVNFDKTFSFSGTGDLEELVIRDSNLDKMKIH